MSGTPFSNVNNIHVHSMIPEEYIGMFGIVTQNLITLFMGSLLGLILICIMDIASFI